MRDDSAQYKLGMFGFSNLGKISGTMSFPTVGNLTQSFPINIFSIVPINYFENRDWILDNN